MDKSMFRLSDNEKADILFDLINPNFNEDGNWEINSMIVDVYDDYALCVNKSGYTRVYYTKDGDNITIGDTVAVKIVDVTESEYTALETIKTVGGSFEAANEAYSLASAKIEELEAKNAEFEAAAQTAETETETEIETEFVETESEVEPALDNSVEETEAEEAETTEEPVIENTTESTNSINEDIVNDFTAKIQSLEAEKVEMEKKLSDIISENESLVAFKKAVEKTQKEAILNKYEEHLSETAVTEFKSNMDNYSVEDFKKEVCTAAVESDSSLFANKQNEPEMFFKGGNVNGESKHMSPAARLINNYKNGGNK